MLGEGVLRNFESGVQTLVRAGAEIVAGGQPDGGVGFCHRNTLLKLSEGHLSRVPIREPLRFERRA